MSKISSKSSLSPKQKKCSCGTLSKLWPDLGKIVSIHLICYRYKLLPFLRIMILLSTVVVGWGRGATLGRLTSVYALLASLILAESMHPNFSRTPPKQKSWKTYWLWLRWWGRRMQAGYENRNFRPVCRFIWEMIQDRAVVTMQRQ